MLQASDLIKADGLYQASREGNTEKIASLLEAKANVTQGVPLIAAVQHGHADCVEMLIKAGVDTNKGYYWKGTPLILAARFGYVDCIRMLIEAGANVEKRCNSETPLLAAVEFGHVDCVRALIKAGADVNKTYYYGDSPLIIAARLGYIDCVKVLIKAGANVDQESSIALSGGFTTPLLAAVEYEHIDCIDILLQTGAKLPKEDGSRLLQGALEFLGGIRAYKPIYATTRWTICGLLVKAGVCFSSEEDRENYEKLCDDARQLCKIERVAIESGLTFDPPHPPLVLKSILPSVLMNIIFHYCHGEDKQMPQLWLGMNAPHESIASCRWSRATNFFSASTEPGSSSSSGAVAFSRAAAAHPSNSSLSSASSSSSLSDPLLQDLKKRMRKAH